MGTRFCFIKCSFIKVIINPSVQLMCQQVAGKYLYIHKIYSSSVHSMNIIKY